MKPDPRASAARNAGRRRTRRLAATALALAALPLSWWRPAPVSAPVAAPIGIRPLGLAPHAAGGGSLTLAGAWELPSRDPRFSGYSALVVHAPGRLRAYSDNSRWLEFSDPSDAGAFEPAFGPVPGHDPAGRNDLEAVAHDRASGFTWIAFENLNSIRRIAPDGTAISVYPPAMARFSENGGAETFARLADGRFLVIAEVAHWRRPKRREALLFARDPVLGGEPVRFAIRPPPGMSPTDAAALPDGRVLILLRGTDLTRWPPFRSALVVADPATIRDGELWAWRPLPDLSDLVPSENYEGLAVAEGANGVTLWLISDANHSVVMQRTLLIKLEWDPGPA